MTKYLCWSSDLEEADAADADGAVAARLEAVHEIGRVEDTRVARRRLAATEANRERARVTAGARGRGQKAGKERLMRGVGEAAGCVTFFPASRRQHAGEVRRPPSPPLISCHIVTKCIDDQEQHVVRADDVVHVHGTTP